MVVYLTRLTLKPQPTAPMFFPPRHFSFLPSLLHLPRFPRFPTLSLPKAARGLHASLIKPTTPPPTTSSIPDITAFLKLIGRNASVHTSKLTWESLFNSTSAQLRAAGIEPTRLRRYIIWQRERYRVARGELELREVKRGKKIDGGERRRDMVRAVRRTQEYRERKRLEEQEKGLEPEVGRPTEWH